MLWEKQRGVMKIVALDRRASGSGLFVGQNLSDARAILPMLEPREIDRDTITRVFEDFADWHSNASPIVSVLTYDEAWGDLALDITGVSHLFGGEAQMLERLTERIGILGYAVQGAIASTLGAAWALAHHTPGRVLAEGIEGDALSPFPVSSLRLNESQIDSLKQFGLQTIGQLYGHDRRTLQARFGIALLLRLDQALGWLEEKVSPRVPIAEFSVERRFPEPIVLIEDVLMVAHDLAVTLSHLLETREAGAQKFQLFLYRVDHKVMTLRVSATRATRDAEHIGRLFSYQAERLEGEYDAGFGIDMIRITANFISPLHSIQIGAFGVDDSTATLDSLYDRMSSRLGHLAVVRSSSVNSHVPEIAISLLPAISPLIPQASFPKLESDRPLRLLPHPEPIMVVAEVPDAPPSQMVWRRLSYRFARASGPERIAAEWYNENLRLQLTDGSIAEAEQAPARYYHEGQQTRDYYVAEDQEGHRFWLFRTGLLGIADSPRWFMHGLFA